MSANILVTGAGGYVGSGLVETLASKGWEPRALGRQYAGYLQVEQMVADLAENAEAAARACEGIDVVVHLAGDNEVVAARQPAFALGSTVLATERLVEAVADSRVKRLVYMSTAHVYGHRMTPGASLTEDMRPEPSAPYAIARLASEHLAATLASVGIEVVVFRLTNSLGAPAHPAVDRWSLVANDLCRQGAVEGRLELRSSGVQWRDFVPLSDVHAFVAAACRSEDPRIAPGTYNLGSGRSMRVRDLATTVQDAFERHTGDRLELVAPDPGRESARPQPYHVSVERATRSGLRAQATVEDAVDDTVRFCIEHREALAA